MDVLEAIGQKASSKFFSPDELAKVFLHWSRSTSLRFSLGLYFNGPQASGNSWYQKPYIIPFDEAANDPIVWVNHNEAAHYQGMRPWTSQDVQFGNTEEDADTTPTEPADLDADWDADNYSDSGFNEDIPPIQLTITMLEHLEKVFNSKGPKKDRTRLDECTIWV